MQGTDLSAYKLLSELGSGGMGKVYLAELSKSAAGLDQGQRVALKVIHSNLLEQDGFFKRFLREAEVGKSVRHQNVVKTHDCDAVMRDGAHHHFLVMEYVEGQTLRDLLKELTRVPEELCRHIGCEVAKGLAAIHAAGVVHRDIKPENVLITEEQVVKVMDLGVARLQDEAIRLSQAGAFVGSLEYAAPEQFTGGGEDADGRADLHALGVVLYELSTGQNPYRDEDARKVLRKILDGQPRKAGEVNPQLSPFFEEVVMTLLAKDREERFATATELADILEAGEEGDWWKERAKALRIETKQPLRRIRVPRETALYGRDDDLAKLHVLFDKAKAGDGQVLLVEGEAGIGKTRLVDEFVGRLRQEGEPINFLFGSYPPGGAATASGAFSTAYREQFGGEALDETLAEYLVETPLLIPAFAALLRGDATPTGAEPLTKDSIQTVFVHATRGLAAERTTIVLIDDLHFAPEDGRGLFASLAMALPGHRVLLVGTSRPGMAEDWVANLERTGHSSRLALHRLGPKDLLHLLQDSFRSERLAEQLGVQVALKSDGNPFFAFEIIRGLREGQFITQEVDGTWVSTQVIQDIQIPSSVVDLIQARLRDLSEEERELLDVSSCCGFEFDPSLVADVLEMRRIPALRAFGRIESRHRLVRSAGQMLVFDHHQVQESLYESMLGQLRTEYHAAIAEALEAREKAADKDPKELDGGLCVTLCDHFLKGGRGESARRYVEPALGHLEAGYLNDQALALAERALAIKGLFEGVERVDLLLKKSGRLGLMAKHDIQEAVLSEARTLAEAGGEDESLAKVESAVGVLLVQTGRYSEARAHLERARSLFAELGDRKGEAGALNGLGRVELDLGDYLAARTHYERALAIQREIADQSGEAHTIGGLGLVFSGIGQPDEARAHLELSIELAHKCGNRMVALVASGNLARESLNQGRHEEARVQFERALGLAHQIGARSAEVTSTGSLAFNLSGQGLSEEALRSHHRALQMSRETGDRRLEAYWHAGVGVLLERLGVWADAQVSLQAALDIAEEVGLREVQATTLTQLADGLAEHGDLAQAEEFHRGAMSLHEGMGARDAGAAISHLAYGILLSRLERPDEAREHLEQALAIATKSVAPSVRVLSLVHLASLEGGDPTAAVAALREDAKRLDHGARTAASFLLYQLTDDRQHLEAAHYLLTFWVEHAPDEYKESTIRNVELHRDIMAAWEASPSAD